MVHLHRFYETSGAIFLLLQYASGGKLWDYVGAYLRYAQEQAREGGPGVEDGYPTQDFQNVYTGFKIHKDDNLRRSFTKDEHVSHSKEIEKSEPGILEDKVTFTKETDNVVLGKPNETTVKDLSIEDFQLDIQGIVPKDSHLEVEIGNDPEEVGDANEKRTEYNRFTSFSSEENADDEGEGIGFSPGPFERQNSQSGQFQDLLKRNKNKATLENFSINSFDSGDGFTRVDSNVSDHIEVIHEVNELNCDTEVFISHKPKDNADVTSETTESKSGQTNHNSSSSSQNHLENGCQFSGNDSENDEEKDDIIRNSKQLLRSVERTLSQIDNEISDKNPVEQINSPLTTTTSSITIDSPEEPSIYDLHHHGDTSDSQSDTRSREYDNGRPTSSEINVNNNNSDRIVSEVSCPTIIEDHNIDKEYQEKGHRSHSKSSVGADVSRGTRNLSLSRLNSTELSRSASSEYESKSPSKARQRTISYMFEQLDLSAQNPEQVKIPESFIRRWAAEIIIALSTLHSLGIICR